MTTTPLTITFASLRYRNYRLWFGGQTASLLGTWMQTTALGFLSYQLTGSLAYLGLVGFATGVPTWVFTLYGGVISDRMARRTLLLITQSMMMIQAFTLAVLTFLGWIQPWHIVALSIVLGIANAFETPARHAFVVDLVDREDLTNAIALNSTMFNLAIALGPPIAGVAYTLFGPAWCFAINGLSFIAVIVALLLMHLNPVPRTQRTSSAISDVKEGLQYVVHHPIIRILIVVVVMTTVFGLGFITLLPAWAVEMLGGDSETNGFLQSARGLGELIAALLIASLGRIAFRGRLLTLGIFLFPVTLLAWSIVRWVPLSLLVMVGIGFAWMIVNNMSTVLIQAHVTDALRGRVMGVYTLAFTGMMPVAALLAGTAAQVIDEPPTVAIGALILLVFAFWLWWRIPALRALP